MQTTVSVPNLLGGVSEQPYHARFPNQSNYEENTYLDIVRGLLKRPNTQHLATLIASISLSPTPPAIHWVNRDTNEKYIVFVFPTGTVRVFDLTGREYPVTNGTNAYLQFTAGTQDNSHRIKCVTLGDATYMVNTAKTVQMSSTTYAPVQNSLMIVVKQSGYTRKYTYEITATSATGVVTTKTYVYTTSQTDPLTCKTDTIANDLYTRLGNDTAAIAGTSTREAIPASTAITPYIKSRDIKGNVVYIQGPDGGSIKATVYDSNGSNDIKVVTHKVNQFTDLPAYAQDGYYVEIGPTGDSAYAVKFVANVPGDTTAGYWEETVFAGEKLKLDPATMPLKLTRVQDPGTLAISFTLSQETWWDRVAGSGDKTGWPPIVGDRITDINLFRGRLAILSTRGLTLSQADNYVNLWRATAKEVRDDDPIYVTVADSSISLMYRLVPYGKAVLLWGDRGQYIVQGGDNLFSPKNVNTSNVASYSFSIYTNPMAMGPEVYFANYMDGRANIYTFAPYQDENRFTAFSILQQCPNQITYEPQMVTPVSPSGPIIYGPSSSYVPSGPLTLFTYFFLMSKDQKSQSAWTRWTFPGVTRLLGLTTMDAITYLLFVRNNDLVLERMDFSITDADGSAVMLLDRRVKEGTGTMNSQIQGYLTMLGATLVTLPFSFTNTDALECWVNGQKYPLAYLDATHKQACFYGDLRGTNYRIGQSYTMTYQFSSPVVRQQTITGGLTPSLNGRVQARTLRIAFANAVNLQLTVNIAGADKYTKAVSYPLPGKTADELFPILGRNSELLVTLKNFDANQTAFQSAEWMLTYTPKAKSSG